MKHRFWSLQVMAVMLRELPPRKVYSERRPRWRRRGDGGDVWMEADENLNTLIDIVLKNLSVQSAVKTVQAATVR